ncbi:MAG: aminoglycoside phosphotransferase family protein [Bacteroidales bacterium]|nr:aminoglycoside phosphotransferase family protein [Bacteroidales bacterium]
MKIGSIFNKFETNYSFLDSIEFGDGNIHSTWKINTTEGKSFILQKFNDYVFKDPIGLMNNMSIISDHLSAKIAKSDLKWKFPEFYRTKKGQFFFRDKDEVYWRLMAFIDHDPNAGDNEQKYFTAGSSYGQFIELLSDLPSQQIIETIPKFHNLPFILKNFKQSVKSTSKQNRKNAASEIQFFEKREEELLMIPKLAESGQIPVRLVHMDTKFDNILFDNNGIPVAIIDLDTVMPGLVHSDFGDAMRSDGNATAEDDPDLSKVKFKMNVFKDYTRGFASSLKKLLSPAEIETLHLAPGLFAYMQGVRFLLDYLNGSKYYNIKYPEHNMVRTRNQIRLFEEMKKKEKMMRAVVHSEFGIC